MKRVTTLLPADPSTLSKTVTALDSLFAIGGSFYVREIIQAVDSPTDRARFYEIVMVVSQPVANALEAEVLSLATTLFQTPIYFETCEVNSGFLG